MIGELLARGFAVATMDWRGQGGSARPLRDGRKGQVDDFMQFECDLDALVEKILARECPRPCSGLCHSMGAAVLLGACESGRCPFERLVLTAPMIAVKDLNHRGVTSFLVAALDSLGMGGAFAPGAAGDSLWLSPFEGNVFTSDKGRFARSRREPERRENLGRRRFDLGVDEDGENLWQRNRWAELIADASHHSGLRTKAGKDIGSRLPSRRAQSRIVDRQLSLAREQAQSRRRIRRASAKSGRSGQALNESEAAKAQPRDLRREQARGAGLCDWLGLEPGADLILDVLGPRALEAGLVEENLVLRERQETFKFVITVGAPSDDRRPSDHSTQGPPASSRSPFRASQPLRHIVPA